MDDFHATINCNSVNCMQLQMHQHKRLKYVRYAITTFLLYSITTIINELIELKYNCTNNKSCQQYFFIHIPLFQKKKQKLLTTLFLDT